jgi:Protein RETICULATA-related
VTACTPNAPRMSPKTANCRPLRSNDTSQNEMTKMRRTKMMPTFVLSKRSLLLVLVLAFLCIVEGCTALASSTANAAKKGQQNLAVTKNGAGKKVWWLLPSSSKPTTTTAQSWKSDIAIGYRRRVAADPSFPLKSMTEIFVAASTHLAAQWRRCGGRDQLLPQFDFVLAGILTAVYGKYAAMWKVAKTTTTTTTTVAAAAAEEEKEKAQQQNDSTTLLQTTTTERNIPTNAFQPFLLDGVTRPTLQQRLLSLLVPVGPLFRAGFLASLVGYGLTAIMIAIRSWLVRECFVCCFVSLTVKNQIVMSSSSHPILLIYVLIASGSFLHSSNQNCQHSVCIAVYRSLHGHE